MKKAKSVQIFSQAIEALEDRRLMSATLGLGSSRLVFNAVKATSNAQTITLTDTGSSPLTISSISVVADTTVTGETSGPAGAARFAASGATFPLTLNPGSSATLSVTYSATTAGLDAAGLQIVSNSSSGSTITVPLRGIGTNGLGGANQPSLIRILQAYSIPTRVGETDVNSAYYPEPPASSSQEMVLQRLQKAGSGPVTITPLASFTASGAQPYTLGTYTPGNPSSKAELFHTLSNEFQTVNVHAQGATQFDPGSSSFAFTFTSDGRTGYSEDQFNTFDTTDPRKVRLFPMENADGTVVPNTFILTTTEWPTSAGYDFTNMVAVVSNVMAVPSAPTEPNLGVEDLNTLPGSNTVLFNRIQNQNATLGDQVHDTAPLLLNNTGASALTISSYALSSAWTLVNPPAFPLTIAAHAAVTLALKFIATSAPSHAYNQTDSTKYPNNGGVYNGALTLNSNDPNAPVTTVKLAGYWQKDSENEDEPSLQTIVNLMAGYGTNINSTPIPTLSESSGKTLYGEEVVSPYWQEANPSQSVTIKQLAAYHSQGASDSLYWHTQGSGTMNKLYSLASDDGQTLLPLLSGTSTPATATFSTSGSFGLKTDTVYSDDSKNSQATAGGHDVRFYPLRTAAGFLVPNTYIVTMDYPSTAQNYDFQDNVYIVSNIRPSMVPPAPTDIQAVTTASNVSLQWAAVSYGSLAGYNVYRSTSATSGYSLITSSPIKSASFIDTTAPSGGTVYYCVTAVDSSTKAESPGDMASAVTPGTVSGDPLNSVGIGETPAGSTTVVTEGTDYNVTAGGPGVAAYADGFRFLYRSQTGDFDLKVQVSSLTVAGNYSTAGLMARGTLDTTSPNVYASVSPVNFRFKTRITVGGIENVTALGTPSYPNVWVRLSRVGNVFTGYYSSNGTTWTTMSSITLALPATVDLGLALASNNSTQTTTATLRNFGNTVADAPATPATPANFTASGKQGGVQLNWSADSTTNLGGYNVYRSTSATGTFTKLTASPIASTSFLDSAAPAGSTSYYQLTAAASSNGAESTAATVSATPLAAPVTLTSTDINATPSGSTTVVTAGTGYDVTAGGPGVGGMADSFRFLYAQQTGNFDVKVQVQSITVAGNYATAGIMARTSLDAASQDVFMSASPANYRFKYRSTAGTTAVVSQKENTSFPGAWVRLARVGDVFNAYSSVDGVTWKLEQSVTISMGTTIYLGLGVASNNNSATTTAQLRNYGTT